MNLPRPALAATAARALADADPRALAAGHGGLRMAIGVAALLGARALTRPFLKADGASPDALTAWRMAGGRDLAMGLGVVLAARRDSPALRGWLEAGALADTIDVAAFSRDTALHPLARVAAALAAAFGAASSVVLARRLRR